MDETLFMARLEKMGVTPEDLGRLRTLPYAEAVRFLGELKGRAKRGWKKLAFQLHPDRTGNAPESTLEFRELTAAREMFEGMEVRPPPPVRPPPIWRGNYAVRPCTSTTAPLNVRYAVQMKP